MRQIELYKEKGYVAIRNSTTPLDTQELSLYDQALVGKLEDFEVHEQPQIRATYNSQNSFQQDLVFFIKTNGANIRSTRKDTFGLFKIADINKLEACIQQFSKTTTEFHAHR